MRRLSVCALLSIVLLPLSVVAEERHFPLDAIESETLEAHGSPMLATGVEGQSIVFDGDTLLRVRDSEDLTHEESGFTFSAWVNPYQLHGQQQMIASKNRYSLDEREWGLMLDKDNRFRLYVWQGKWVTISAPKAPQVGHWALLSVVIRPDLAELRVDGKVVGEVALANPIPRTAAPLTLGGVDDNGHIWQNFVGAIDDVRLWDEPLAASHLAELYSPIDQTHQIPKFTGFMNVEPDSSWEERITEHAAQDRSVVAFDGQDPDKLACDT
ncbi:MAG: LamG domain-containing protein, partial [Planctomycetaceae bacterium]|nr:LamG domain-containing protein [Planctomycetaceae bacterium]